MEKEIKIINYVFKYKSKINLISIEHYNGFETENSKIKLLLEDNFYEKNIRIINVNKEKLIFDDLIITSKGLELYFDNHYLNLNVNNKELLEEYNQSSKNKNHYFLSKETIYSGVIDSEELIDKLFLDYESIVNISDNYYKLYTIDFLEFSGSFNMLAYDRKVPNIHLKYKETDFINKKVLNNRYVNFFKMSTYKFIISGNYYWKINVKVKKTFKSNPSVIPFKYQKGVISLVMKKNLLKTNFKAIGNEMLLISYKYM